MIHEIRQVGLGWARVAKIFFFFMISIITLFALSAIITVPLWFIAFSYKSIYTILFFSALIITFIGVLFSKYRARLRLGEQKATIIKKALIFIGKCLVALGIVACLVFAYYCIVRGLWYIGIAFVAIYTFFAGFLLFGANKKNV